MPDAHSNFAASSVAVAPSPATTGATLTVQSGDGALFPTPPYDCIACPAASPPRASNAEIVRVTGLAGDVFTFTRGPQAGDPGGINRTIVVGDQFFLAQTAKVFTDIEAMALAAQLGTTTVARAYCFAGGGLGTTIRKVLIDTVVANGDPNGLMDVTVNHRYNVPRTGYYQVNGNVLCGSTTSGAIQVLIYKNGAVVSLGDTLAAGSGGLGAQVSDIVYCVAGDYLELWVWASGTYPLTSGIPTCNYLSVVRVG